MDVAARMGRKKARTGGNDKKNIVAAGSAIAAAWEYHLCHGCLSEKENGVGEEREMRWGWKKRAGGEGKKERKGEEKRKRKGRKWRMPRPELPHRGRRGKKEETK